MFYVLFSGITYLLTLCSVHEVKDFIVICCIFFAQFATHGEISCFPYELFKHANKFSLINLSFTCAHKERDKTQVIRQVLMMALSDCCCCALHWCNNWQASPLEATITLAFCLSDITLRPENLCNWLSLPDCGAVFIYEGLNLWQEEVGKEELWEMTGGQQSY